MLRRALPWLAYPLTTGGAVLFCVLATARGWPAWAIGAVVVGASSVLVAGLERVIPYRETWSRSRGDVRTDIWHFLVSNRGFDLGALVAVAFVPRLVRLPALPLAVEAAIALAIYELPGYWIHRIEHESQLMWRIHAVHHSAERLYWLNLSRNHPLDDFVTSFASLALVALAGVREEALAVVAAFTGAHAILQHSNVDLRTGWLDVLLSTARVHRWHHSRSLAEANANYGQTITLWDWVFRSRRFEASASPPESVGLEEGTLPGFPTTFLGQLASPFDGDLWRRT